MALPRLEKITFDKCPECGCRDIGGIRLGSAGNGGPHTCGEWREFITFRCGAEYEYTPNFSKIVCNRPCQKEGVNHVTVDVTVRLTLQLRKETDISEVNPLELFKVPGIDSCGPYQWRNHDKPHYLRQAVVVRANLVKTTKLKKKKQEKWFSDCRFLQQFRRGGDLRRIVGLNGLNDYQPFGAGYS